MNATCLPMLTWGDRFGRSILGIAEGCESQGLSV